jgi:hypothetical protein
MRGELYRRLCHHADEVTGESRAGLVGRAIEELLERESKDAPPENWEGRQARRDPLVVSWPCPTMYRNGTKPCDGALVWRLVKGRWWGHCDKCNYGTAAATGEAAQLSEQAAR